MWQMKEGKNILVRKELKEIDRWMNEGRKAYWQERKMKVTEDEDMWKRGEQD